MLAWRDKVGYWGVFLVGVVIAPWLETFIGQTLPWGVTRLLRLPAWVFLIVSTLWFAVLHGLGFHGPDFWVMFLSHLLAAYLLALTYLQGHRRSEWRALWMTAAVHTLVNLGVSVVSGLSELARQG